VRSILDNKLDRQAAQRPPADAVPVLHPNIRGPDLRRRHPRSARPQRPSYRSRRRQLAPHPTEINHKGLTSSSLLAKNNPPAGRLKRATSCRNSERHDLGMTGRHRRNQHRAFSGEPRGNRASDRATGLRWRQLRRVSAAPDQPKILPLCWNFM
jgi:hypothetical protein